MKTNSYKIKKDCGKFHILCRKAGHNYFELTGESFFSKQDAETRIAKLKAIP